MPDELYTIAQAALYLKVCEKTVRRLIQHNSLTASKVGHVWRIKQEDINTYLKSNNNQNQRVGV
ncbi:MAG: helix-turn-helix domain-containing protein [Deltaproteobacteria bacterium]|jgi:excisionase family DNA binding protein|nr:helix-turn-helix domain-containing protein [Deltaproteobacteria bacterium]